MTYLVLMFLEGFCISCLVWVHTNLWETLRRKSFIVITFMPLFMSLAYINVMKKEVCVNFCGMTAIWMSLTERTNVNKNKISNKEKHWQNASMKFRSFIWTKWKCYVLWIGKSAPKRHRLLITYFSKGLMKYFILSISLKIKMADSRFFCFAWDFVNKILIFKQHGCLFCNS